MSPAKASRSSTELLAGFRVERRLGDDVWEAFQPELARRVALRRIPPGTAFRAAAWPDHPGVVVLLAVVEDPSGTYVATRFVPGARTLAELRSAPARSRRRWLGQAQEALAGTVHGALTEHDILVGEDGRALVTGFGLAPPGATEEDDRAALERMRPPRRRGAMLLAVPAVAAAVGAGVALAGGGGDPEPSPERAPRVTAGAVAVGSDLGAGPVTSADCEGAAPSGSSLPCTVMQGDLPGRPLVAASDGIVRAWAVRGVSGRVRLQVLMPVGDRFTTYNHSDMVAIADAAGTRVVPADLAVPAGARFALEVSPGATVGIRGGVPGARTLRFFSPLRGDRRTPDPAGGEGQELMLRVDLAPRG
jgi:hypothetical protein